MTVTWDMETVETHTHTWGPIQTARFSGEPSRPCTDSDCKVITLDLYLYCTLCGGPATTTDEPGVYTHLDPKSGEIDAEFDTNHVPVVESGEAPYDEEHDD